MGVLFLMSQQGWIKIHRKLVDHWLWQDAEKLKWWLCLLIEANHEGRNILLKGSLVTCGRGQCVRSLETWAQEWRTTKKTVRNFLLLLERDGMIQYESVTVSTRITICNYDTYQNLGNEKETQSKRKVNAEETQSKRSLPPNNNDKNEENEKKLRASAPTSFSFSEKQLASFARFQEFLTASAPRVLQMKEPFTIEQYLSITEDFRGPFIKELCEAMHNHAGLLKNNLNANLTFRNWARRREVDGQRGGESPTHKNGSTSTAVDASDLLAEREAKRIAKQSAPNYVPPEN